VPDKALKIQRWDEDMDTDKRHRSRGLMARLHVVDAPVIDDFTFLAPGGVPATVSFDLTWTASGKVEHFRPQSSDPADPTNFAGEFRNAVATGSFSGSESGFSFTATGSSAGIFAEMGTERNGVFLRSNQ
jgi:hypothetical protein